MRAAKVLKFGGTSMGSSAAMSQVIEIVKNKKRHRDGRVAAVIVSAMSGVTNQLILIANLAAHKDPSYRKVLKEIRQKHINTVRELIDRQEDTLALLDRRLADLENAAKAVYQVGELSPAALDYIMSFGERLSARVLAAAMNERGVPSEYLNARHVVVTDDNAGSAAVDFDATDAAIAAYVKKHKKLQVVTGFIGATHEGVVTTLGRGGSDYSAAIFGAAIDARVIEIWTDVSGIMTADPRLVPEARVVPELAFEEAGELAYFGAKVLHPKTILPAMRKGIPVKVLNTFKPQDAGTTIVASFDERKKKSKSIEALTVKKNVVAVHILSPEFFDGNGLMARIVEIFDYYRTSIDVVTTSVASVSVTVEDQQHLKSIVKEIGKMGKVRVERGKAIICAVGGAVNTAKTVGRMFTVLGTHKIPVEMISQEASNVSITFVVTARDAENALKLLHKEYIQG